MRLPVFVFAAIFLLLSSSSSCKKTASAPPPGPRACKADSDCVIACESRESFCHNPYCEGAQHGDDAREIREANEKRCTPADQQKCPQVGARVAPDYVVVPRCKASACVAEKVPK